jgi:chorismate mutase/prephenate dehydratase
LDRIRVVYSHPQALAQCSNFLDGLDVIQEPVYDTAGSAKMIKERNIREAAAIASERAADLYGLRILRRNIQDFAENFTRFYVIGRESSSRTGQDKTSIVFVTNHTPGSLHRALGELATRGINLTKIESRPIKGTPWEYRFFIDFEGHQTDPGSSEAIAALGKSSTFLKILGSYPRMTTGQDQG